MVPNQYLSSGKLSLRVGKKVDQRSKVNPNSSMADRFFACGDAVSITNTKLPLGSPCVNIYARVLTGHFNAVN